MEALQHVPLFAGLDAAAAASVANAVDRVRVAVGATLIEQGDAGDALYVVLRGRFAVEVRGEDATVRYLGEISAGELVGEMAMLSAEPRAATIRALRASEVLRLTRAAFETIVAVHPDLMRRLASLLAGRLRNANAPTRMKEKLRTVALVAHDSSVPLDVFAGELHAVLRDYGECELVGSAIAPPTPDRKRAAMDGEGESRKDVPGGGREGREEMAMRAVAALDRAGRVILLVGDDRDPQWNAIVLAQADLILVVANADGDCAPGAAESIAASKLPTRRELVLLHAPGSEPSGTARWLTAARFTRHHHLRRGDAAHTHRLARRLAGKSVGLVLGGGGARGFAHIGALRAFAELGIPIDRVGGTSMGSIIAAQVALGWESARMHERTRMAFSRDPLAWDNTLPFVSKITCNKVVRLFQGLFGDARAEDCWLPYFSVSCSLTDAHTITHRAGALWQCVRASSALPGLGPPVIEGGKFIVDGAILDNLPAELLADEGMGPVIAINVSPKEDLGTTWADNYSLSGWRILWERLRGTPGAREYPSALWVLQRTVLLGSVGMAERMKAVASLFLHLPVGEFEMFTWSEIDPIVEVGYASSKTVLEAWSNEAPHRGRPPSVRM